MSDNNSPLEKRINRFYKSQKLSPEKLAELKAIATPKTPAPPPQTYRFATVYRYAAFAALALVLLVSGLFSIQRYNQYQHLQAVAAEIALNHAKDFNTEFESPNIAHLSSQMHLLDFSPVHPQRMQYSTYDIQGARYCTIENSIAVQIHLEDDLNTEYTLYEFRDPSPFLSSGERVVAIGDIEVTLWREGDVVMGLAHRTGSSTNAAE